MKDGKSFVWRVVLRLENKIINASDDALEQSVSLCEKCAVYSGALVVVGLVAEIGIAWIHPAYNSILEQWGSVIANFLVGIGVSGEVLFSARANTCQGELIRRSNLKLEDAHILSMLADSRAASARSVADTAQLEVAKANERAAEATERAANAELATERLKSQISWRRLSAAQIVAISEVLDGLPTHSLEVSFANNDPEANTFARDIGAAFSKNGWRVCFVARSSNQEVIFGLRIPMLMYQGSTELLTLCARVQKAISAAGIGFTYHPTQHWGMSMSTGDEITRPCPTMYVGSKPLPIVE